MRGQSGIITLTLSALLIGGCATQSDVMRGNKIDPYQNTDRPLILTRMPTVRSWRSIWTPVNM